MILSRVVIDKKPTSFALAIPLHEQGHYILGAEIAQMGETW
jgi:hypothetical protein